MKALLLSVLAAMFVGCSSSPFEQATSRQDAINKHLAQGVRLLDGEFDSKYMTDGSDGMYLKKVGVAVYPIGYSEQIIKSAAVADGKFKLASSAPTEMKQLVQRAIGNSLGYAGEFNQIQTSVSEVYALRGIESSENDIQCRTQVTPTVDGSYRTERVCRALVRVPLTELVKAYDFTVEKKYGKQKKSEIQKMLQQQLKSSISG